MGALQFQASQVISRLEQAVERAADGSGGSGGGGDGSTWNNSSGFLSQPKKPDEILALIQVSGAAPNRSHWAHAIGRGPVDTRHPLVAAVAPDNY